MGDKLLVQTREHSVWCLPLNYLSLYFLCFGMYGYIPNMTILITKGFIVDLT